VIAELPDAAHGAELTVDLGALTANWSLMKGRAGTAECGAVIKANAYGCGIPEVAGALFQTGCRSYFVAHLREAREARSVLPPDAAIYVLNALLPGTASLYRDIGAIPVLGSGEEMADWVESGEKGPVALHVDTGMNRLGLAPDALRSGALDRELKRLNIALVMTHFAASEDPSDASNDRQIAAFARVAELFPETRRSLLNSSGHFLPNAPAYDLTRPGYALYGGNPTPGQPNPMRPVVTLTATILQIREVEDGEAVGYNGKWHAKGRRKLATICLGYADGYPRNASNTDAVAGGAALVGGVTCPIAGTVSMDLIILDVTEAPADAVRRGAPVTLIGGDLPVDRVGPSGKTIGYELLTSLGRRYRRRYLG
jgi:alanine racemase